MAAAVRAIAARPTKRMDRGPGKYVLIRVAVRRIVTRPMYFDRAGTPIDVWAWAKLLEDELDIRRVALDFIGPYRISTVWLGLDHQFLPGGPPLIFETMVFALDEENDGLDCARYSTEPQAVVGHAAMVARYRALVDADLRKTPK
jgi:hypothetical protein